MTLRLQAERILTRWTAWVLGHRGIVVACTALVIGMLATGLPRLRMETSFESYLPKNNPALEIYERFRGEFGSGERVVILLRPAEMFDPHFLAELVLLHDALEERLPYLDDVTSLVNARHLVGGEGTLTAEGLLDDVPQDEAGLERLRAKLEDNALYENIIVSQSRAETAIVIELDGSYEETDAGDELLMPNDAPFSSGFAEAPIGGELLSTEQARRLVRALEEVLSDHAPESTEVFVAGTPVLAHRLGAMLTRDIAVFIGASLCLTALLLAALFGNAWAMIHPLLVVVLSVVGTLGGMGLAGLPLTAVTEVLPSLLITIGVGDAIHIQSMYYKQRELGAAKNDAIVGAMGHSGLAVLLTSVTTAASMAAFQTADLQPIIDLGRAAPFGIMLAFLLSVTLLPVLLASSEMGAGAGGVGRARRARAFDRVLVGLGRVGTRRPLLVVCVVLALSVLGAAGAMRLRFSQDDLKWLPADDPLRIATEQLNTSMGGAEPFELHVKLGPGRDLREPAIVAALSEIQRGVSGIRSGPVEVAKVLSLGDVLEETHRVLRDPDDPSPWPDSRAAVSQELLLFEAAAPDDLERLVDARWQQTRLAISVPFVDALYYPNFARDAAELASHTLGERGLGDAVQVIPTGLLTLAGETFELLFVSMVRSYLIGFAVIALLMLLLIGNLRLGLMSWLPNVVPILLVLGLMGWIDAPLDISSMLVGGILIGVVVDDTIHFAHTFARYREEMDCSLRAIRATLETTGRAMLITSTVLSLGFLTFAGASLSNVADFGLFCGAGVILAFLADIVVLPALVSLAAPCPPDCACHKAEHDLLTA